MTEARRGDLWLLDFGEPVGDEQGDVRPVLVVSSDDANRHAETVVVLLQHLIGRVDVVVMTAVEQTMRRFFGG